MNNNIPREFWFIIVFLFMLGTQNAGFFALLFLVGMLYLARNAFEGQQIPDRETSWRQPSSYEQEMMPLPPIVEEEIEPDHVLEAIATAGHDPDTLQVLPTDIGLLVYKDEQPAEMYRAEAIPDDVDYIRPFVELELPRAANGRIRFEILDGSGASLFVYEDTYQLQRGNQPIIAPTWLPVDDTHDNDGMWQLKISADGLLLANHIFEWNATPKPSRIRQHIEEDGEISSELRSALAENRLQKMSLDELLSNQEDDEPRQSQSRS